MKNLESIAEDLFNKIRGRFPSVTIGTSEGKVTNVPAEARYYDFDYKESGRSLGKISVSLDEKSISVMYSNDFVANEDQMTQDNWYNFLKELRQFSKRRLLNFDTRNITKSNLDRRDYKFLALTRTGEDTMTESAMYGTSKTSFQNIGNARVSIKHNAPVNQESAADRTRHIGTIYVENNDGERFKYPYKHLSGARAMARHVSEGGAPYDDFGTHIVSMSEELSKLRKFKTYINRSNVMAEGLGGYVEAVAERMDTIRKTLKGLQRENFYKESFEGFEKPMVEDVPADIAENWIDQLTIKQFNEELKDVFPFVYKVVSEYTKAKELGPDDLAEAPPTTSPRPQARPDQGTDNDRRVRGTGSLDRIQGPANTVKVRQGMTLFSIAQMFNDQNNMGGDVQQFVKDIMEYNGITSPQSLQVGQTIEIPYSMGTGPDGASRGLPPGGFTNYESQIEAAFDEMMGQFGEAVVDGEISVDAVKKNALELLVDIAKTSKQYKGEVTDDQVYYLGSLVQDFDMAGIETEKYSEIEKLFRTMSKTNKADMTMIQPAYAQAKGLDEDANNNGIEAAVEEQKTPLGEFILSYFDYTTGQFPKGETAILTMVEKDYGEHFIEPAKQFLEKINHRVSEVMGYREEEESTSDTKLVCKDCGDELNKPTTNCPHDSHDPSGDHWVKVDVDGDGDDDIEIRSTQEHDDIMRLAGL